MNPAPHADRDHSEQPIVIAPIPRPCRGCGATEAQQHTDDCPAVIQASIDRARDARTPSSSPDEGDPEHSITDDLAAGRGTSPVSAARQERVQRYAEAIDALLDRVHYAPRAGCECSACTDDIEQGDLVYHLTPAVVAVADAEQEALRAEVESMRRGDGAAARDLSEALRRAEAAEAKAVDFEGRYETAHANRMHAERALKSTEDERDQLAEQLAKVRALADEWQRGYNSPWARIHGDAIRAILDADPAPEGSDQ